MGSYYQYVNEIKNALLGLLVTDRNQKSIDQEKGVKNWVDLTHDIHKQEKNIYFIGNGASAMMASHMSADACKNGKLKASCFNEQALMTAISNDISYEEVFSLPLQRFAQSGDLLISISSSGNSKNITKALRVGRELELKLITLSGMSEKNESRTLGDLNFYIPSQSYGIIESTHQALLHSWLDFYMEESGLSL